MQEWTKLNCPAPRAPRNGISFIFDDGQRVQYRCHPGFIMKGKVSSVCINNKWNNPPPLCLLPNTYQDHLSSSDKVAVPTIRNRFNWESNDMEPSHISLRYGNGSSRLPLINGLWKNPSTNIDSRVLSIVPDSSLGNSVPPKQLIKQEVDIAELRKKLEQEVKSSRHINDKGNSITKLDPQYPPFYVNPDGFVLGVSNSNRYPVYSLGTIYDSNRNNYPVSGYLEPEMVELRRKQIEEAKNIQMIAASKRHRNKFNNIVTYSSRDIPVWQGRIKPQNRYHTEKTVYKATRVERNKHFEQDKPPSAPFNTRTVIKPNPPAIEINKENFSTDIPKFLSVNRPTVPLLTEDIVIATMPTPISEFLNLGNSENNKSTNPTAFPRTSTSDSKNELHVANKYNRDPLEWPPEALWFKHETTAIPRLFVTQRIHEKQKKKSSNKKSNRGNKRGKNTRKSQKAPIVTFSHGRVKSTNLKKTQK
ncbi:uncharacterized protein LOC111619675 [Centruroides sculpturatus]|nr:uncharacterized protein LOC111619675 [Centruroides sculpturatus]